MCGSVSILLVLWSFLLFVSLQTSAVNPCVHSALTVYCDFPPPHLQMRRFVRRKSSSAGTACAWPRASSAMVTMTVETTAMKRSARQAQPPHAALGSSAATTPSVSRLCGAATATPTAEINQTSRRSAVTAGTSRRSKDALLGSSSVSAGSASISTGNATATQTARTSPMRQTVVSTGAITVGLRHTEPV